MRVIEWRLERSSFLAGSVPSRTGVVALLALAWWLFSAPTFAQATRLTVLHNFSSVDGRMPQGNVVQGSDGSFYGTTYAAGPNDGGTVFRIAATRTLTTLFSFGTNASALDGSAPIAALIQAPDGTFYGTTSQDGDIGDGTAAGWGTVFKITPEGVLTKLHTFVRSDGTEPSASLLLASDGNFYGTTVGGGAGTNGTIFRMTPAGALTTLYAFQNDSSDGAQPKAALIEDSNGDFYGTAPQGGTSPTPGGGGGGVAFKITKAGVLTTLRVFPFAGTPDVWGPTHGLVLGPDGAFYGTAGGGDEGAGTVYKLTSDGALTVLHSFSFSSTDGAWPSSALTLASDDYFYGTTQQGGAHGFGTIYRIAPDGTFQSLHSFTLADGEVPNGVVEGADSSFYGTAGAGGTPGEGTVFRLTIAPEAPTDVTATGGTRQVTLAWTTSRRALSYDLYQATSSGGQSATPARTGITAATVTITGLADGTTYFFTIVGENEVGPGLISSEVSATTLAAPSGGGSGSLNLLTFAALLAAMQLRRTTWGVRA